MSKVMNNEELVQWLRDNSSGIYRPARDAADVIECLEAENAKMREELLKFRETFRNLTGLPQ